jgi:hypothetical protein
MCDVWGKGWAGIQRTRNHGETKEGDWQERQGRLEKLKGQSPCPEKHSVHGQTCLENTVEETYEEGLLYSFREKMRGIHYLNRSHPPYSCCP